MGDGILARHNKRHTFVRACYWAFVLLCICTTDISAQSLTDRARLTLESTWRQDFSISVRTGREMTGNVYRAGEKLQISVLASVTAFLQVFATSPDGEIVQLFPDAPRTDNRISADKEIKVPPDTSRFALQMAPAAGTDLLTVVLTDQPHPLLQPPDLKQAGNVLMVRDANRLATALHELCANSSCKVSIQHVPVHTCASDASVNGFGVASATDGWLAHLWVPQHPVPSNEPVIVRVVSNQSCRLNGFFVSETPSTKQTALPLKNIPALAGGRIVHLPRASDSFALKLHPSGSRAIVHLALERSDRSILNLSCPITSVAPTHPTLPPPANSASLPTGGTAVSASLSSTIYPHPAQPVSVTIKPASEKIPTVVSWGKAVSVVFPSDAIATSPVVTIGPPSHSPPIASGVQILSSCQISLSGASLQSPAVVALRFDRATLPKDALPEGIMAIRWDDKSGGWETRPTSVDMQQGVAVATTEQFSIWYLIYIAQMCVVENTENFRLVYVRPGWVETVSGPNSEGETFAILGPTQRLVRGPEAAFMVGQFIERAYQAYGQAGLPRLFSGARTRAEAAAASYLGLNVRPFTEWVFLNCNPTGWRLDRQIGIDPNYRSGITGAIVLNRDFDDLDDLRVTVAHELFHAIQNEYSNLITQRLHEWWADATADFAACRVAWGGQIDLDPIANPIAWLELPLWNTDNNRAYYGDHLVAHLLDTIPGATLPNLMTTTFGRALGGLHGRLSEFTRGLSQELFHWHFQDFAAHLLFSARYPVGTRFLGSANAQSRSCTLAAVAPVLATQSVILPLGMSATARLIRIEVPSGRRSRRVRIATEKDAWVNLWLYHLPGGTEQNTPRPIADFSQYNPDHVLDVAPGDLVALLGCNFEWSQLLSRAGPQGFRFSVTDESPILSLTATPERGNQARLVLRATVTAIPDDVRRLRWEWQLGDGRRREDFSNRRDEAVLTLERRAVFPTVAEQRFEVRLFDITGTASTELALATMTFRPIDLKLSADPNPVEPDAPCELQAVARNAPRGARYQFFFSDTPTLVPMKTDRIRHSFTTPGTYSASVHVLASGSDPTVLAIASTTVSVVAPTITEPRLSAPFPLGYVELQRGEYAEGNQDFAEGAAFTYQILERHETVAGEFEFFDLRGPKQKLGASTGRATFTARCRFIEAKRDDPWLKGWGSPLIDRESRAGNTLPFAFDRARDCYATSAEGRKKGYPPQVIGRLGGRLVIIILEARCMGENSPSGQASFIPAVSIDTIAQNDAFELWSAVVARSNRQKPASRK